MLEEKREYDEQNRLKARWYEDENGLKQGEYNKYFRGTGKLMEEGQYVDGKKEGEWKLYSSNGLLAIENYKNDKREGEWKEYNPLNNELISSTTYLNNNVVHQLEYKEGKLFREINMKLNNEGINEYNGKYYLNDGITIKDGFYSKDGFSGTIKQLYSNGQHKKIFYVKADLEYGEYKEYYENGQLSKILNYNGGVKDGEYTSYYENGQPKEIGEYSEGKKIGVWTDYFKNGVLNTLKYYEDGNIFYLKEYFDNELILTKEYYENRILIKNYKNEQMDSYEEHFKDKNRTKKYYNSEGKLKMIISDKEMIGYYENGQLKVKAEMNNSEFKGNFEEYWDNGNLKTKCFYIESNGFSLKHGKEYHYSNNGKLIKENNYDYDELFKSTQYDGQEKIQKENFYKDGKLNKEVFFMSEDNKKIIEYDEFKNIISEEIVDKYSSDKKEYGFSGNLIRRYKIEDELKVVEVYNDNEIMKLEYFQEILRRKINYKDGQLHGEYKEFYENGQLGIVSNYKNGKLEGEYKHFRENGVLDFEANYKDGKREGEYKTYYENGNLAMTCNYENDKREGICVRFNPNGTKDFEEYYESDTLLKEKPKEQEKEGRAVRGRAVRGREGNER